MLGAAGAGVHDGELADSEYGVLPGNKAEEVGERRAPRWTLSLLSV